MSLQSALDRADSLGTQGRWFDAHEALESFWMKATGERKILLQGLIQVAAGLHRLKLHPGETGGAFYLLDRGREKLTRTKALLVAETLAALERELSAVRASGNPPAALIFGLKEA